MHIVFGANPGEVSWDFFPPNEGEGVNVDMYRMDHYHGTNLIEEIQGVSEDYSHCIPAHESGKWFFHIRDLYGDGIANRWGHGYYELFYNDQSFKYSEFNTDMENMYIDLQATTPPPPSGKTTPPSGKT